jgi:hypothetical protein
MRAADTLPDTAGGTDELGFGVRGIDQETAAIAGEPPASPTMQALICWPLPLFDQRKNASRTLTASIMLSLSL